MDKPLLLDLYCGAGGAGMGYHLAGFEVIGVDSKFQPHYPFEFIQCDALEFLDNQDLSRFAAIHSSPECKAYTGCNLSPKERYQKQIGDVRNRFKKTGKLYVIENVEGAKRDMQASLLLCGTMFGLPMRRHRLFETNITAMLCPPKWCDHRKATIGVYGHSIWDSSLPGTPRKDGKPRPDSVSIEIGREVMGCPWMSIEELAEAIPPVYTRWIGEQLLAEIATREKVAV